VSVGGTFIHWFEPSNNALQIMQLQDMEFVTRFISFLLH
jgi:hypothetical protein